MINIDTWAPWIAISVTSGPILLAALSLAYSLYISHRHLGAIKEALKNSRYIYIWGPSLGKRGLIWSLLEISKIAGMILLPRASIIIGELDPDDLKHFPPHLKRYLIVNMTMTFIAAAWIALIVVLLEFR